MDIQTGEIYSFNNEEELANKEYDLRRALAPLTTDQERELWPLPKRVRKNKMRNHKCVCGSGIKFKKCCWSKYA